jgi:signal recognition particle subunit SRP54
MGPLNQLMGMIPGMGAQLKGAELDDNAFSQIEAIIHSMTRQERLKPQLLNGSRRRRIARGSGTTVQDINRLVKQFQQMQKMMKRMNRMNPKQLKRAMPFMG